VARRRKDQTAEQGGTRRSCTRFLMYGLGALAVLIGCGVIAQLADGPTPITGGTATPTSLAKIAVVAPTPTSLPTATARPTDTPTPNTSVSVSTDSSRTGAAVVLLPTATSTSSALGQPAWVVNVVDGDSIEVMIDGQQYSLRYILIDTPEYNQPLGPEAFEANRQLVEGKTVYLQKDVSEADQYGRLLRYVYLEDGTFVNAELVRLGVAEVAVYPPDTAKEAEIRAAQQEVEDADQGQENTSDPPAPVANRNSNLRSGPGIDYAIVGGAVAGQRLTPVGWNQARDWLKLESGEWIAAFLVDNIPDGLPVVDGPDDNGPDCDPAYPTVCIPPPPPDLDCGDIDAISFTVRAPDPHNFDGDGDGVGCEPAPPPQQPPQPVQPPPQEGGDNNCGPAYPDVCIPPPPPDLDCNEIPYRRFRVLPPDPHRFDGDNDGIGCER